MYLTIHPTSKEFYSEYGLFVVKMVNYALIRPVSLLNFIETSILFSRYYVNKAVQTGTYLNYAIILHKYRSLFCLLIATITFEKCAYSSTHILNHVRFLLDVEIYLAMLPSQTIRACAQKWNILLLVFFLDSLRNSVLSKFYHKIINLSAFAVKLILAEEQSPIICSSTLIFKADWIKRSQWIHYEVSILSITLNTEL